MDIQGLLKKHSKKRTPTKNAKVEDLFATSSTSNDVQNSKNKAHVDSDLNIA